MHAFACETMAEGTNLLCACITANYLSKWALYIYLYMYGKVTFGWKGKHLFPPPLLSQHRTAELILDLV